MLMPTAALVALSLLFATVDIASAQSLRTQRALNGALSTVPDQGISPQPRPLGPGIGSQPLYRYAVRAPSGDAVAWRIDLASGSGPGFATARALDLDEGGNMYLAGAASVEPFGTDLLVAKVDQEGMVVWEATYGGAAGAYDEALAVAAGGGSVFALGRANHGRSPYDGVLVRLDATTGDVVWAAPLEGLATFLSVPLRLAHDGQGGVVVAGTVRDEGDGDRLVITRFSADGAVVWTNTQSAVVANGLFSDGSGGVYVLAQGELVLYGPEGDVVWTLPLPAAQAMRAPGGDLRVLAGLGAGVIAIQSYTAEGEFEWEAPFDFSDADFALSSPFAMSVDEAGNTFAFTGRHDGSVAGGLMLRAGPEGAGAWSATFDAEDLYTAFLAPDGEGGAYVAGTGSTIDPVIRGARFGPEGDLLWTLEHGSEGAPAYLGAAVASEGGRLLIAATEGDAASPARVATVLTFDPQGALAERTNVEGAPTSFDYLTDVAPAPDGGVYVGGITWTPDGGDDLLLARVADDGTVLWAAAFDDGGLERAYDVAVAHDGGAVVAGVSGDFDCLYATLYPDDCDILVAAYSPNGEPLWSGRWDGGGRDYPVGVVANGAGGALVGGLSVDPTSGDADAVALRFDAAGEVLWEARYTGPDPESATSEYPVGAFALANGTSPNGIVLAGTDGYVPGGNGAGLFAVAFGPDGEPLWEAHYGGPVDGHLSGAAAATGSASGRTYVSGVIKRPGANRTVTVAFGPDGSEEWAAEVPFETVDLAVGPNGAAHLVGADYPWQPFPTSYAARVTSEGAAWTAEFGPGTGTSVEVDEDGYAFVAGTLARSLLETDAVLHVYGPDGDEVWSAELEAREAHPGGGPLLVLSGDNAYVALTERASNPQAGYWGWTAYATVALWQIDSSSLPVGDEPDAPIFPDRLHIKSVSPNPVRGNAVVSLGVAEPGPVRVEVYDVLGRRVAVLHDGWLEGGTHVLALRTGGLASGPYVIRAASSNGATTSQLVTIVN